MLELALIAVILLFFALMFSILGIAIHRALIQIRDELAYPRKQAIENAWKGVRTYVPEGKE